MPHRRRDSRSSSYDSRSHGGWWRRRRSNSVLERLDHLDHGLETVNNRVMDIQNRLDVLTVNRQPPAPAPAPALARPAAAGVQQRNARGRPRQRAAPARRAAAANRRGAARGRGRQRSGPGRGAHGPQRNRAARRPAILRPRIDMNDRFNGAEVDPEDDAYVQNLPKRCRWTDSQTDKLFEAMKAVRRNMLVRAGRDPAPTSPYFLERVKRVFQRAGGDRSRSLNSLIYAVSRRLMGRYRRARERDYHWDSNVYEV